MRPLIAPAIGMLLVAAAIAVSPATAASGPGQAPLSYSIGTFQVANEGSWHGENTFSVNWAKVDANGQDPPTQLAYRIDDEAGKPTGPARTIPISQSFFHASIPTGPEGSVPAGVYHLIAWLQNESAAGPAATATLRFDGSRPSSVRPIVPSEWLRAGSMAEVKIEHPSAPLPPSGIRGYAIELDRGSGSEPCGGHVSCALAETDLAGGENDDSISLGPLAEGTNIVSVVAVSGTGMRSARAESATLHVDGTAPAIGFSNVPAGWSNHPVELEANASDDLSGVSPTGPTGPLTAIAVDGEPPTVMLGARADATVHGDGVHDVTAFARDAVGNTGAADPEAASLSVQIDETAPRVSFASSQNPDQPERIVAVVGDPLSGPSRSRGSIQVRALGSSLPFVSLPTTVAGDHLLADWDSDSYPRGPYEFRAIGFDAAGNRTETVRRADGAAMLLSNPVKLPTLLAVGFGGRTFLAHHCRRRASGLRCDSHTIAAFARRPASTRVACGRRVPVGGLLTSKAGTPLGGRAVTITETFDAGAVPARRETTAVTGPDGVFLAHLDPGPSRQITVSFAGNSQVTRAISRPLALSVRTALRLRTSAPTATVGGAPVDFTGRLGHRGATIPSGGVAIELEFRVAGLPWSEFRTIRSDSRGRFRYVYAFSDDDSRGIRFQFRARVAAQAEWAYDEAISRPVVVTGR